MLKLLRVSGQSLAPIYQDGDFVLTSKIPILIGRLYPGDVVVANHPDYGILIKLVKQIDPDGRHLSLVGLHPDSVDSRRFGPIPMEYIQGKVIWVIKRPDSKGITPGG